MRLSQVSNKIGKNPRPVSSPGEGGPGVGSKISNTLSPDRDRTSSCSTKNILIQQRAHSPNKHGGKNMYIKKKLNIKKKPLDVFCSPRALKLPGPKHEIAKFAVGEVLLTHTLTHAHLHTHTPITRIRLFLHASLSLSLSLSLCLYLSFFH